MTEAPPTINERYHRLAAKEIEVVQQDPRFAHLRIRCDVSRKLIFTIRGIHHGVFSTWRDEIELSPVFDEGEIQVKNFVEYAINKYVLHLENVEIVEKVMEE